MGQVYTQESEVRLPLFDVFKMRRTPNQQTTDRISPCHESVMSIVINERYFRIKPLCFHRRLSCKKSRGWLRTRAEIPMLSYDKGSLTQKILPFPTTDSTHT